MAKDSIKIDEGEINAIERVLKNDNKKYKLFINKYNRQKTKLVSLLKPLKSRETFNRKSLISLNKKLEKLELAIKKIEEKYLKADEIFRQNKANYDAFEDSVKSKLNDINLNISLIKKETDKENELLSKNLEEKINLLDEKYRSEKGQTNILIEKLDLKASQDILEQKIKLDEQLKTDDLEIAAVKKEIEIFKGEQKSVHKGISVLRKALEKIDIDLPQLDLQIQQLEELTDKNDLKLNEELEECSDELADSLKEEKGLQEDSVLFYSQIDQLTKEISEREQQSVEIENIIFQMNQDDKKSFSKVDFVK